MTIAQQEKTIIANLQPLYALEEARNLAYWAIMHVTGMSRSQMIINKQQDLSLNHAKEIDHLLEELKTGKPIQYILSEVEFYGMSLLVSPDVLIPRPETEELVRWILEVVNSCFLGGSNAATQVYIGDGVASSLQQGRLLDLCTGSGCIPVALKKNLPHTSIFAVDISTAALAIARENALRHHVDVEFISDDVLNPQSDLLNASYDLIVSNPPYVRTSEKSQMHVNVLDYEPHLALFVPDEHALIFYEHIADFAAGHLNDGGYLFFEINEFLAQQTIDLLRQKGFQQIELRKDLRGKDRMLKAIYSR